MAQQKNNNKINHRQRQGDWICNNCNNMNFAFRDNCNRCHTKKKENKGFGSALFLQESNGDIPPISDRSNKSNDEKNNAKFSFDKLPSIEPILKQIKVNKEQKYDMFEFEWQCQQCQKINQYYKIRCIECGSQRYRKLTL